MAGKAVIFGAGKIGRGFLAQLATQSGYEIVFVDVDPRAVASLNESKTYVIKVVGKQPRNVTIGNYSALLAGDEQRVVGEIAVSDVVFTAVGAAGLESAAQIIAKGLEKRASRDDNNPVNIILCENLLDAPDRLRGFIEKSIHDDYARYLETRVGIVPAIVSRMVPDTPARYADCDPLMIITEAYDSLPIDRHALAGSVPDIYGLLPIDNFRAYVERKLFIHNAGHSLASYQGHEVGYVYVFEAIRDENIRVTVLGALGEVSEALIKKHCLDRLELEEHIGDLMVRFDNEALEDSVARGARSPLRKLSPNDRLIGAAKLALEYGVTPKNLVIGIAAALRYECDDDPEAERLREMLKNEGVDAVLIKVCGLSPADPLYSLIKEHIPNRQEKGPMQ